MKLASSSLMLPCGLVLANRLAKAAMTEQLAKNGDPGERLQRLYARFCSGGAGLVITGNVMIHRDHREHPRNVVLDDKASRGAVERWRSSSVGAPILVQLSHPGRQALFVRGEAVAPSPIATQAGPVFKKPRALSEAEIDDVVARFAFAAKLAEDAGFAGVQLHAAHGYLLSQFLSPRSNQRTDRYGGSLENRARFLLDAVARVRAAVKPAFAVTVKLNSADFQKGGFDDDDAIAVMKMLAGKIDLLEISGGTYEAPAMVGMRASTRAREAYFLEFAARARREVPSLPLMVTGGFRTPAAMEEALASGALDVVGLARPLAMDPDFPRRALAGDAAPVKLARDKIGVRLLDGILSAQAYVEQMHRIADGKDTDPDLSPLWTIAHAMWMSRVGQ
jgi:2,4-dienoyl-CoA reductase-like NADH-dependent reductase (Old Yellow Enzyme family)